MASSVYTMCAIILSIGFRIISLSLTLGVKGLLLVCNTSLFWPWGREFDCILQSLGMSMSLGIEGSSVCLHDIRDFQWLLFWGLRRLRLHLGLLVPVSSWLTCHDWVHCLFTRLGIEGSSVYLHDYHASRSYLYLCVIVGPTAFAALSWLAGSRELLAYLSWLSALSVC